jgi:hypothetical protein
VNKAYLKSSRWLLLFWMISLSFDMRLKKAGFEIKWTGGPWLFETFFVQGVNFCDELPCFSTLRRTTHLQILHGARWNIYLSNGIKHKVYLCCIFVWTLHQVLKKPIDSSSPIVGNSSTKVQHPWQNSVDTKHFCLDVKFEARFVISFTRKPMSNKKCPFSQGMVHRFSKSGV